MSKLTKEEKELIDAAMELAPLIEAWQSTTAKRFNKAAKKFREEKPAQVYVYKDGKTVEATPEVIIRLGPDAGASYYCIIKVISEGRNLGEQTGTIADTIMKHIADAAPKIDGKLT